MSAKGTKIVQESMESDDIKEVLPHQTQPVVVSWTSLAFAFDLCGATCLFL